MALTKTTVRSSPGSRYIGQTEASATADNAVAGTSGTLLQADIDNTGNLSAVYLKLYNHASPTVGTTAPEWVFRCPAQVRRIFSCVPGSTFATNLSMACVTNGGTAGTVSPANPVIVRLLLNV